MYKSKLLIFTFATALTMVSCQRSKSTEVSNAKPFSQQMVESHGLGNFACNKNKKHELATTGWDYVSGLVANAVLKAWEKYPEKSDYFDAVKAFADFSTSPSGDSIFKAPTRVSALGESNIDDLAAGKIFFTLYKEAVKRGNAADSAKYRNAVTMLRNKLKYEHARIPDGLPGAGGFFHKRQYPCQMWLDGLYMGPALYAQWQYEFGVEEGDSANMASWSDIAHQFKTLHTHTYDNEKQLNYHAWSALPNDSNSFWANKTAPHLGCSKEFWGRGMGWYFAAMVDILEWMPKTHPDYEIILGNFRQVAAGLHRWQDERTGLWYQLLQYGSSVKGDGKGDTIDGEVFNVGDNANYLEASASSMYAYVFYKAVRLGLLDKEVYLPVAEKAYDGIISNLITFDSAGIGIKNICASAGLGPAKDHSRTGTINYYLCGKDITVTYDEGKAIGPFIMASLEKESLY
jgi:unsaturated rhamnogalacturonyl hydrolase